MIWVGVGVPARRSVIHISWKVFSVKSPVTMTLLESSDQRISMASRPVPGSPCGGLTRSGVASVAVGLTT